MEDKYLNKLTKKLKVVRQNLHAYPELSLNETKTSQKIVDFLEKNTDATIKRLANTGVLASFTQDEANKRILIRADIDALPIQEVNTFSHKSKVSNVSHKCGHDGHTVILLGLACLLTKYPLKKVNVFLLWQPAEEIGKGAVSVLADRAFSKLQFDYVYALHNLPKYPKKQIIVKKGAFTPQVKSLIIKLKGKTAHAAEPEQGHNPAAALSEIVAYCKRQTYNKPKSKNFFLITPVYMSMGSKSYGISAGEGELHLTIRSWSPFVFERKVDELLSFARTTSATHKLLYKIDWTQEFDANINDDKAVDHLIKALEKNNFDYKQIKIPFKWGEDFGLFTQRFKGAMFGIGSGENCPALHNPDYDFPDEITETGFSVFYQLLKEFNK